MRAFKLLLPVILVVVSVSLLQADIKRVPKDHPDIQIAINATEDGDTVLVLGLNRSGSLKCAPGGR